VPSYDIRVDLWCAASARQIIGPVLFYETLNSNRFIQNVLEPFFERLTDEDSMAISNKMAQLYILQTTQEHYEKCLMTEFSVQNCGLPR
jgi:hypothetical protein